MSGSLYVVATPIGNVEDISERAIAVLTSCDLVIAEDTRHTGRLLARLGIDRPMRSFHEHSDDSVVSSLIGCLQSGQNLALVSDAGTPLISDPGYELVRAARESGLIVLPIPGACAAVAALSVSGLPPDRFCFCGFAPAKSTARRNWLESLSKASETLLFYESSHRINDALTDFCQVFGAERPAFVAREMTKLYEQHLFGTLGDLVLAVEQGELTLKGEFVLVIGGAVGEEDLSAGIDDARRLLQLLIGQMSPSHAARTVAAFTGLSRKHCYELAEDLKTGEE